MRLPLRSDDHFDASASGTQRPWGDRYHPLTLLAEGGMARTYLALLHGRKDFSKLVVVKEMRSKLVHEREFVEMFAAEARLTARMRHPQVVQGFDADMESERPYIVLEYLDGVTLSKIMRRVPSIPQAIALRIVLDVLAGLEYVHNLADFNGKPLGIVHRDVSPQNVMVTYAGEVKVLDFGIAAGVLGRPDASNHAFKGKISYMSPEQVRTERVDRRADVFCVGIMLWEALTAKRMWDRSGRNVAEQVVEDQPIDPRSVQASVPARLAEICLRALAKDKKDRYPSALSMAQDLELFARATGELASTSDVAAFISEKFGRVRAELHEKIDDRVHLIRAQRRTVPDLSAVLQHETEQTSASESGIRPRIESMETSMSASPARVRSRSVRFVRSFFQRSATRLRDAASSAGAVLDLVSWGPGFARARAQAHVLWRLARLYARKRVRLGMLMLGACLIAALGVGTVLLAQRGPSAHLEATMRVMATAIEITEAAKSRGAVESPPDAAAKPAPKAEPARMDGTTIERRGSTRVATPGKATGAAVRAAKAESAKPALELESPYR